MLTEKDITHGDILVRVRPIGGFRMIDGNEADDKIVAVLNNDAVYGSYKDISDVPEQVVNRLKHYFLTYKDIPGKESKVEITEVYGIDEAHEIIQRSVQDYHHKFDNLDTFVGSLAIACSNKKPAKQCLAGFFLFSVWALFCSLNVHIKCNLILDEVVLEEIFDALFGFGATPNHIPFVAVDLEFGSSINA